MDYHGGIDIAQVDIQCVLTNVEASKKMMQSCGHLYASKLQLTGQLRSYVKPNSVLNWIQK